MSRADNGRSKPRAATPLPDNERSNPCSDMWRGDNGRLMGKTDLRNPITTDPHGCRRDPCNPAFGYGRSAVGCSVSFCIRQFNSSATYSSFSVGQAISCTHPNCFGSFPASPSTPSTFPSSVSL